MMVPYSGDKWRFMAEKINYKWRFINYKSIIGLGTSGKINYKLGKLLENPSSSLVDFPANHARTQSEMSMALDGQLLDDLRCDLP